MRPWKILTTRPLFSRPPWLELWEENVRLPNGTMIEGYLRTCARDYAMVFALLVDGTVPLVQQYKHGVGQLSYDLPAGYLETPDELPLAAAQRELREETGLTAPWWEPVGHLVVDTNRGGTRAHIYLARGAQLNASQDLDPTEALEVSYHTPAKLRAMVHRGEIDSMASAAAIMAVLDLLRDE